MIHCFHQGLNHANLCGNKGGHCELRSNTIYAMHNKASGYRRYWCFKIHICIYPPTSPCFPPLHKGMVFNESGWESHLALGFRSQGMFLVSPLLLHRVTLSLHLSAIATLSRCYSYRSLIYRYSSNHHCNKTEWAPEPRRAVWGRRELYYATYTSIPQRLSKFQNHFTETMHLLLKNILFSK